jgi:hypothetical protein
VLADLDVATEYQLRVACLSAAGAGEYSAASAFRTLAAPPESPGKPRLSLLPAGAGPCPACPRSCHARRPMARWADAGRPPRAA